MSVHFDDESSRIELGVADLLEPQLLRSIGFANRGGFERLWLGQALHGRYQERALADDPTYRREVFLRHEFEHRGWQVSLCGRADGVRKDEGGRLVLEEIKSVRREGQLSAATRQVYERQARLYAWMLARSESAEVAIELVLIAIGSDAVDRERVEADFEALESDIHRRLNALLAEHRRERRASSDRRRAGDLLAFPHAAPRPGHFRP